MDEPMVAPQAAWPSNLLAVDIGNSNICIGLGGDGGWSERWRLSSAPIRTADEYELSLRRLLERCGRRPDVLASSIISSVVPELTAPVGAACERVLGRPPMLLGPGLSSGMEIRYHPPQSLGPDRIADAVAARERYGAPVITVDFGSATTFNVVDGAGRFIGGAIAPGLETSAQALADAGARLHRVVLEPGAVHPGIGRSTVQSMRSGVILGFAGLVSGLLGRLEAELAAEGSGRPMVVATGGLVYHIAGLVARIDQIDEDLLFDGLRLIAARNLR